MDEGQVRLVCPTCKADQCMRCGVEWHTGSTCAAFQEVGNTTKAAHSVSCQCTAMDYPFLARVRQTAAGAHIKRYFYLTPITLQWSKQNAGADEEFRKLQAKEEFKPCPKCGNACQKISGCNHVVCAKV